MSRVVHLAPVFAGGIARAAAAIASLAPGHTLATTLPAPLGPGPHTLHLHHALAWPEVEPALRDDTSIFKTIHILQRRQNLLRQAPETKSSALQAAILARAERLSIATAAARDMLLEDHPELPDLAQRLTLLPLPPPAVTPRAPDAASGPIVALTRFDRLKGTDLLVEALPALLARFPDRRVVLAGGLPDHGKAERKWLRAFADATAHSDRLVFAGWLAPDAARALLAGAALFLAPSRLETCGLALMEALAASCPVVAFDQPVHREVAVDAALYAHDGASLLERASELLASPDEAEALGRRGPSHVPDPSAVRALWLHFWGETR